MPNSTSRSCTGSILTRVAGASFGAGGGGGTFGGTGIETVAVVSVAGCLVTAGGVGTGTGAGVGVTCATTGAGSGVC
jgi:hypothetical protein